MSTMVGFGWGGGRGQVSSRQMSGQPSAGPGHGSARSLSSTPSAIKWCPTDTDPLSKSGRLRECRTLNPPGHLPPDLRPYRIGNESVPIQLAQCRFPLLAIFNAKILTYFSNKIHGRNFIKRHSETVMVWNYQNADCSLRKTIYRVIYYLLL